MTTTRYAAMLLLAATATTVGLALAAPANAVCETDCTTTPGLPPGAVSAFEKFPLLQNPPAPVRPPQPIRQFTNFLDRFAPPAPITPPNPIQPPTPVRPLLIFNVFTGGTKIG